MSRRFVPPAIAAFGDGPDGDLARLLARAREEGFAEGHEAGLREGHAAGLRDGADTAAAEYQVELIALQEKFAKQQATLAVVEAIDRLADQRTHDLQVIEDAARAALTAALRALFPTLLEHAAGEEIAAVLADALVEREPEPLMLRAHPATLRSVMQHDLPGDHAVRLSMQDDPAMPLGVADVGWTGGGLTFDLAALHQRVAAILSPVEKEPAV